MLLHVTGFEDGGRAKGESMLEILPVGRTQDTNHELVLAVEGEIELGIPGPLQLRNGSHSLGEAEDCLVGRITVNLSLREREILGSRIKFTSIAETGNAAELLESALSNCGRALLVSFERLAGCLGGHFLKSDAALCDDHFVLPIYVSYGAN